MKHRTRLVLVVVSCLSVLSFVASPIFALAPVSATAFQDADAFGNEPTAIDVLAGVSAVDGIWSPSDVVPVGPVEADFYATGVSDYWLDALSLEFDTGGYDLTNLTFRAYLQKGNYNDNRWEHYQLYPGAFNPTSEDPDPSTSLGHIDHFPGGNLPPNELVGWLEIPFDATSDPSYQLPNGNTAMTFRMWNWRVDAVELTGTLMAGVDIRPGSNINPVNLKSNGVLPVAIYGSDYLDVSQIDLLSLDLDGAGADVKGNSDYSAVFKDINGDSILDLLVFFEMEDLVAEADATELTLFGMLEDGTEFRGSDSIKMVPPLELLMFEAGLDINGLVEISSIPEPATMALLALGGVVLIRRRRG